MHYTHVTTSRTKRGRRRAESRATDRRRWIVDGVGPLLSQPLHQILHGRHAAGRGAGGAAAHHAAHQAHDRAHLGVVAVTTTCGAAPADLRGPMSARSAPRARDRGRRRGRDARDRRGGLRNRGERSHRRGGGRRRRGRCGIGAGHCRGRLSRGASRALTHHDVRGCDTDAQPNEHPARRNSRVHLPAVCRHERKDSTFSRYASQAQRTKMPFPTEAHWTASASTS